MNPVRAIAEPSRHDRRLRRDARSRRDRDLRGAGERGREPAPRAISSRSAARPSSSRASRSGAIPTGWCGPWTFGQPDVVRLQSGVVLCWRPQGELSDVTKSLFACLGCHLLPRRSAPSGTDRLWLERGNWRLEHTDVAELGWTDRGWRLGLLRVQPCPTVCSKELIQLKSGRVDSAIVGHGSTVSHEACRQITRSLQADGACATSNARLRPAPARPAAAARPNSVGRRRSVLIRGKARVRRCRLAFHDCGAGTGDGLVAWAGSHGCGVLPQTGLDILEPQNIFISVSIGASAGSNKMASMSVAGCKKMALCQCQLAPPSGHAPTPV